MGVSAEWRERHGSCTYGTYRPAATEGWVVAGCTNAAVGNRYSETFCACECAAYRARATRDGRACAPRPVDQRAEPTGPQE